MNVIDQDHQVDHAVPELKSGFDEVVAFADFCYFLSEGAVRPEALALADAARALLASTRATLVPEQMPRTT